MTEKTTSLELKSLVKEEGAVELSLVEVPVATPKAGEIVVRVEAAPINPSDLGLLFGGAEAQAFVPSEGKLRAPISANVLRAMRARVGQSMGVGNEGAGVVVAAGSAPEAQALLGKNVALIGGSTYSQYRVVPAAYAHALPDGTSTEQGAAWFINPMTALAMVETMRAEGHRALIHTAAASNLGQMLQKLCLEEGIALVNIVRRSEQAELLRGIGAQHVVDSSAPSFTSDLIGALAATGATLAFDAIGGGTLAGQLISAMEVVASRDAKQYNRYGSPTPKQVYNYGILDTGPIVIQRSFGMSWGIGGWLLPLVLQKLGPAVEKRLRERAVAGLKTTFASAYTQRISLRDVLAPETLRAYAKQATGQKYLVTPQA